MELTSGHAHSPTHSFLSLSLSHSLLIRPFLSFSPFLMCSHLLTHFSLFFLPISHSLLSLSLSLVFICFLPSLSTRYLYPIHSSYTYISLSHFLHLYLFAPSSWLPSIFPSFSPSPQFKTNILYIERTKICVDSNSLSFFLKYSLSSSVSSLRHSLLLHLLVFVFLLFFVFVKWCLLWKTLN